jgi:hypothetical protein
MDSVEVKERERPWVEGASEDTQLLAAELTGIEGTVITGLP